MELAQELGEVVEQQQQHTQCALVQQPHLLGAWVGRRWGVEVEGLGGAGKRQEHSAAERVARGSSPAAPDT